MKAQNGLLGGLLPEPKTPVTPVMRAADGAGKKGGGLPQHVDLRPMCSPVEAQLNVNSCAANAVVGALECHQRKTKAPQPDLSRLFVYYNARKIGGCETADQGTAMSHVMAAVMAWGVCEEKVWPYIEGSKNVKPPADCYAKALQYQALEYARVPYGDTMLRMLACGIPIVFGFNMPDAYYKHARDHGFTPGIDENSPPPDFRMGHAMVVVGYDLGKRAWLIRNSWGPDWADGGHFWTPFETMEFYCPEIRREWSFWAFGRLKEDTAGMLEVVGVGQSLSAIQAEGPQLVAEARATIQNSLRTDFSQTVESARKGIRDRLRGPGN